MYRTINCCQGGSAYRRKSCDRRFKRRPQNSNQQYCYRKICQNKRCRAGVAPPFFSDLAYRDNQLDSQERSLEKWLIYWRQYRERNAEYVAGNRRLQRALDQPKRDLEHKRSVLIGGGVLAGYGGGISPLYYFITGSGRWLYTIRILAQVPDTTLFMLT